METNHFEDKKLAYEVLRTIRPRNEPEWTKVSKMSYFEFYNGLKERNWTSRFYFENAEPWSVVFFRDSGRFLRTNEWDGYNVLLSTPDGNHRWVYIDYPGAISHMSEYESGGTLGSVYQRNRGRGREIALDEYGYNQVFEEIFGAFEQKLSDQEKHTFFDNAFWIHPAHLKYDARGGKKLDIQWQWTAADYSLGPYLKEVPKAMFWGFTYSFIAVAIGISLFTRQRKPPMDVQGAVEFAYSKADARKDGKVDVKFCDVAGMDDVISQLKEVVELLKHPMTQNSGPLVTKPPKGVLLEGEPGTGKTLLAKAIAGEAGVAFYQMSGAEFIQAIVGVGAARIRDLFRRARVNKPCVIFIDEIDAIGVRRAEAGAKTNEEREQTLNQLLTEMDGFSPSENIVLVAATNRADLLDSALLRAGRFDRKVTLRKPDVQGREAVLMVHGRKFRIGSMTDLAQVARDTPNVSPANLANLLNEAGLEAIRRTSDECSNHGDPAYITGPDLYVALDRIHYGIKRDPLPGNSWLKDLTSITEAGKALIASLVNLKNGRSETIVKVSVASRGLGRSYIDFARFHEDSYLVQTRGRLIDRLKTVCAGRAAEEVLFNYTTNYVVPNIASALRVARQLVHQFSAGELATTVFYPVFDHRKHKPIDNLDDNPVSALIPRGEMGSTSQKKHRLECSAFSIVNEGYTDVKTILKNYRATLWSIAVVLREREEVTGTEILRQIHDSNPKSEWILGPHTIQRLFLTSSPDLPKSRHWTPKLYY